MSKTKKTAAAKTPTPTPIPVAPGVELHGEIVTWSMGGNPVAHSELIAALEANDLPTGVIRELLPRHAFSRACSKLREQRIIRRVEETDAEIRFQFTVERRTGDGFEYDRETILTLDKSDGTISCDLPDLATAARAAFDEAMGARTPGDVTKTIQRLFDKEADLFSIRPQGGCYFVPAAYADFLSRIESFVSRLNGTIGRFPVPKGTAHGDASVKVSVAEGMAGMIREHMEAIESFDVNTHAATMEKRAEAIKTTRYKLLAYAEYLGSEKERLEATVFEAADLLRARVELLAEEKDATTAERGGEPPEREPCIDCGTTRGRRNPHGFAYARSEGRCGACRDKHKRAGRPAGARVKTKTAKAAEPESEPEWDDESLAEIADDEAAEADARAEWDAEFESQIAAANED
jgi:hypothetical protein